MENHWLVLASIKGEAGTESRRSIPTPVTCAFIETAGDKLIKRRNNELSLQT